MKQSLVYSRCRSEQWRRDRREVDERWLRQLEYVVLLYVIAVVGLAVYGAV